MKDLLPDVEEEPKYYSFDDEDTDPDSWTVDVMDKCIEKD